MFNYIKFSIIIIVVFCIFAGKLLYAIFMNKLYLDIDGVLLTTKNTKAAEGSLELINYAISNYECYWLTTHCRNGETTEAMKRLCPFFPPNTIKKLKHIKPTNWSTLKTEAIDFSSSFVWLDDSPFKAEKLILERHHCLSNLILVNLNNENELYHILNKLKAFTSS